MFSNLGHGTFSTDNATANSILSHPNQKEQILADSYPLTEDNG